MLVLRSEYGLSWDSHLRLQSLCATLVNGGISRVSYQVPGATVRTFFIGITAIMLTARGTVASPTMEEALSAWKARQAHIACARIAWKQEVLRPKGSVFGPDAPRSFNPRHLTIPAEDTRYEATYTVKCDRDRFSYAYQGRSWSGDTGEWSRQEYISVFDGKDTTVFWPSGSDPIPNSVIRTEAVGRETRNVHTRAVMMAFRAIDSPLSLWRSVDLFLSSASGTHKGRPCIIVEERASKVGQHRSTLWVDPSMDYAIVRCTIGDGMSVHFTLDVTYHKDALNGYLPKEWSGVLSMADGRVKESFHSVVTDMTVNDPGAVGEITVDLPANTYVIDERTKERYLLRPGGHKRIITQEERLATYEQLVASESGQGLLAGPTIGLWAWVAAGVGLAVLLAGTLLVIHRLRRRAG